MSHWIEFPVKFVLSIDLIASDSLTIVFKVFQENLLYWSNATNSGAVDTISREFTGKMIIF